MQTFFLLPVVGGVRLLDEPKECLHRRLCQKFNRSFFYKSSFRSYIGNFPCKTLLFTSTPIPSSLRSWLHVSTRPRGHHEILKTVNKHIFLPYLLQLGTKVLHFDMISLPISIITPLSGLPLRFPSRGWTQFLLGRQNMPWACSIRCLGYIVILVPSSLNWPVQAKIKSFSVRILVCKTLAVPRSVATRCLFLQDVKGKYSVTAG